MQTVGMWTMPLGLSGASHLWVALPDVLDDGCPAGIVHCQVVCNSKARLGGGKDGARLLGGDMARLQDTQCRQHHTTTWTILLVQSCGVLLFTWHHAVAHLGV